VLRFFYKTPIGYLKKIKQNHPEKIMEDGHRHGNVGYVTRNKKRFKSNGQHRNLQRNAHFHQLNDDVQRVIGSFNGPQENTKNISRELRRVLRGINTHYKVDGENISEVIVILRELEPQNDTSNLQVTITNFDSIVQERFRAFCQASDLLYHMSIVFRPGYHDPLGALAIAELKHAPFLRTLRFELVGLGNTAMADAVARALAKCVVGLQRMHTLKLDISGSRFSNDGAGSLVALRHAPTLHTLHLELAETTITDIGLQNLAVLDNAPALRNLYIGLNVTGIGNRYGDNSGIAALGTMRRIRSLHLNLDNNFIGVEGAKALSTLGGFLTILRLDLFQCDIGDDGALALSALKNAPLLEELHLGLGVNRISRMGAQYLVNLGNSRTLNRLHLDMFDNDATFSELNEIFAVLGGLNHLDFGFSCHH
jgi:hypothetical protein